MDDAPRNEEAAENDGADSVDFYWRPGCGFCARLEAALHRAGVTMIQRNIWSDREAAAFVRSVAKGNETVPTVVVAGTALVNPRPGEVLALLGRDSSSAA
jgi:glutaredoxin